MDGWMSGGAGVEAAGSSWLLLWLLLLQEQIYPFSSQPFSTLSFVQMKKHVGDYSVSVLSPHGSLPRMDPEPECSTTLRFSASDKELWGDGSNPSLVGSIILISPPKKCPF